jgi:hypothetical protein
VSAGTDGSSPPTEGSILNDAWQQAYPASAAALEAADAAVGTDDYVQRRRAWEELDPRAHKDWGANFVFATRRLDPWSGAVRARQLDRVCRKYSLCRIMGAAPAEGAMRCVLGVVDEAGTRLAVRHDVAPRDLEQAEAELLLELLPRYPLADQLDAYAPEPGRRASRRAGAWRDLTRPQQLAMHWSVDLCRSAMREPPPRGVPCNLQTAVLDAAAEKLATSWEHLTDDELLHLRWALECGLQRIADPADDRLPGHQYHRIPLGIDAPQLTAARNALWPHDPSEP